MTSPHSPRPLATYMSVIGSASASNSALSPTRGLGAAHSSSCNLRAALTSLRDLRASPLTGVLGD
jgi:hypothetical protein